MKENKNYKYEKLDRQLNGGEMLNENENENENVNENVKDMNKTKWNIKLVLISILILITPIVIIALVYFYKIYTNTYNEVSIINDIINVMLNDDDPNNNMYEITEEHIILLNYKQYLSGNDNHNSRWKTVNFTEILDVFLKSWVYNNHSKCQKKYPNSVSCYVWIIDFEQKKRYLLTNSIPSYYVAPYCPWGVGKGYCIPNGETNCTEFYNITCPSYNNLSYSSQGDVPIVQWFLFNVSLSRNPTDSNLPKYLYSNSPELESYTNNTEYFPSHQKSVSPSSSSSSSPSSNSSTSSSSSNSSTSSTSSSSSNSSSSPYSSSYSIIGLHIIGQMIFGPSEAEHQNIDLSGIKLVCGAHVTPPVLNGPLYHYHKLSTCLPYESLDDGHGPLLGYANDGFAIYGINDYNHKTPIVDECNGHFGYVPCLTEDYISGRCAFDVEKKISYHYHAFNFTYTLTSPNFYAYYLGCQGPSKLKCNSTYGHTQSFCSPGCGYQICIQPGTNKVKLKHYFKNLGAPNFLEKYTHNSY